MPSAPVTSSAATSSRSPALTITLTRCAVAGDRRAASRSAANAARRFWRSASGARTPRPAAGVGRTMTLPLSPSSSSMSPSATLWRTSRTRPSTGTPIARATIVTCAVSEPSSSITPFSRRRSYSSSSAGPRLRAIRIVSWRRPDLRGGAHLARDDPQQPVRQILEIVHPVGEQRIVDLAHAHRGCAAGRARSPPRRSGRCRSPR